MTARRIDVPEAHAAMQNEKGAVYLDVRSEEEFAAGHPAGAMNIPIGTPNPAQQRLDPNPDFLAVAKAVLRPDAPVLVGCKTGPRAEMAARLLDKNGWQDVRWVLGGFHGMTDPMGNVVAEGWKGLGLPEGHGAGGKNGYQALRKRALG